MSDDEDESDACDTVHQFQNIGSPWSEIELTAKLAAGLLGTRPMGTSPEDVDGAVKLAQEIYLKSHEAVFARLRAEHAEQQAEEARARANSEGAS